MLNDIEKKQLSFLILKLQDGSITSEELKHLDSWLAEEDDAFSFYCSFMKDISVLKRNIHSFEDKNSPVTVDLLKSLAEHEQKASEIIINKVQESDNSVPDKTIEENNRSNRFYAAFDKLVYIAAVLMISFIIYAQWFSPEYSKPVAIVEDQINVTWGKGSTRLDVDDIILTNQPPYKLEKGIVQIKYNHGVDVLIEGPAEFEFNRLGMFVKHGRLYSKVSKSGRGFTIDTPHARFVDLGTEFGVNASISEIAELHVNKGQVQLYAGLDDKEKETRMISEGQAVRFDARSGVLEDIIINKNVFAREIDSSSGTVWRGQNSLDLSSIIAGMDGFKKVKFPVGINPMKGEYDTPYFNDNIITDNKYNQFLESPYIDGIFVPDGGNGKVTISSTGLAFDCPNTSGKYSHNICVFQGGLDRDRTSILPPIFSGKDYEMLSEPALLLHSNCGITVDLMAIRNENPGLRLDSFNSWGGITEAVIDAEGDEPDICFWVLVDGNIKYEKNILKVEDGIVSFDIKLNENDRFLTLIVSDALKDPDRREFPWANDFFYLISPKINFELQ